MGYARAAIAGMLAAAVIVATVDNHEADYKTAMVLLLLLALLLAPDALEAIQKRRNE